MCFILLFFDRKKEYSICEMHTDYTHSFTKSDFLSTNSIWLRSVFFMMFRVDAQQKISKNTGNSKLINIYGAQSAIVFDSILFPCAYSCMFSHERWRWGYFFRDSLYLPAIMRTGR